MEYMRVLIPITVAAVFLVQDSPISQIGSQPAMPVKPASVVVTLASDTSACPSDMVEVEGDYCPEVEQRCLEWLDTDQTPEANRGMGPLRCKRFEFPSKCLSKNRVHMHFCVDIYEWPNMKGALPPIGMTYWEAKALCEAVGKRLLTTREATLACEGPELKPYPYGYERDATACNIDKPSADPETPRALWPSVYRAVPAGSMERCVSDYGVHDIVANVDEWVTNETGKPFVSALHGGYWGPVRTRCRPKTWVHGPSFSFYQIGFRCHKDIKR